MTQCSSCASSDPCIARQGRCLDRGTTYLPAAGVKARSMMGTAASTRQADCVALLGGVYTFVERQPACWSRGAARSCRSTRSSSRDKGSSPVTVAELLLALREGPALRHLARVHTSIAATPSECLPLSVPPSLVERGARAAAGLAARRPRAGRYRLSRPCPGKIRRSSDFKPYPHFKCCPLEVPPLARACHGRAPSSAS